MHKFWIGPYIFMSDTSEIMLLSQYAPSSLSWLTMVGNVMAPSRCKAINVHLTDWTATMLSHQMHHATYLTLQPSNKLYQTKVWRSSTYWFLCFCWFCLLPGIPACDKRCHIGPVMTTPLHYSAVPMSGPCINGAEVRQLEDGMHFKWEEHFQLSVNIIRPGSVITGLRLY